MVIVRESFCFSVMFCCFKMVFKVEKFVFVEEVIKMFGMEEYVNVVVGILGEGFNVE